jgi:hypothetical protein
MNAWTKAAVQGAACGLMIGALLLTGGRVWRPSAVDDVARARAFELIDASGKVRASLAFGFGGSPVLSLYDSARKVGLRLSLTREGDSFLTLSGSARRSHLSLFAAQDGKAGLDLYGAQGRQGSFQLYPDRGVSVVLYDTAATLRTFLGTSSLEYPRSGEKATRPQSSLVLFGQDGKVIWTAP